MKLLRILTLLALLALHKRAEATINFPSTLDDNTTLHLVANGQVYIANFHNDLKDAILAVQTKVGVDNSAATTSLDYILKNTGSVNPGHKHTTTSVNFSDGTAGAPGLLFGNPVSDTNSGFFHPASGQFAISSGSAEIIRVTATGLGVKTTNPFFPLDVVGTLRLQSTSSLCFGGSGAGDNDTCVSRSAAHVATLAGSLIETDQAIGDTTLTLNGIAAKTGNFLSIKLLPADANPIVQVSPSGVLGFGVGGASAIDTTLTRSGANAFTASGALTVSGNVTVSGTGTSTIGGSGATVNVGTGGGTTTVNVNTAGTAGTNIATTTNTGILTLGNTTGGITIPDSVNISTNATTGTKIGTTTSQKIGFYNASPVVQQTTATALVTALQNLGLIAAGTFSGNIVTTGTLALGTSGNTITRLLTGSATLDFANVAAGPECSADLTITVTNAATGDVCAVGVPSAVPSKSTFFCYINGPNAATVRHCCMTGACDPASATYKVFVQQ
jgi:hypothetical protein